MATFNEAHNDDKYYYKFFIRNKTVNTIVDYDFRNLTKDRFVRWISGEMKGEIKQSEEAAINFDVSEGILKSDSTSIISLQRVAPLIKFWSGSDDQYINLLSGGGFMVDKDTSELSEVVGHNFRVTVDGGGVNNPDTLNIYIQVYDAN